MSAIIDDGGPAYPRGHNTGSDGMTLRDYFAGQALAGMMANSAIIDTFGQGQVISIEAFRAADAMLIARKGGPQS